MNKIVCKARMKEMIRISFITINHLIIGHIDFGQLGDKKKHKVE